MLLYCYSLVNDHVRYGVTANITAFHAVARGSIPRIGVFLFPPQSNNSNVDSIAQRTVMRTMQNAARIPPYAIKFVTNDIAYGLASALVIDPQTQKRVPRYRCCPTTVGARLRTLLFS